MPCSRTAIAEVQEHFTYHPCCKCRVYLVVTGRNQFRTGWGVDFVRYSIAESFEDFEPRQVVWIKNKKYKFLLDYVKDRKEQTPKIDSQWKLDQAKAPKELTEEEKFRYKLLIREGPQITGGGAKESE
jgi:hypothetical protein